MDDLCVMCAARASASGCSVCGAAVRPGASRCAAHSSAALRVKPRPKEFLEETATGSLATTARIDPGTPLAGLGDVRWSMAERLRHLGRAARTPLLVGAAIVGFNLAFPVIIANQRPTVLTQSGGISSASAASASPAPSTWPASAASTASVAAAAPRIPLPGSVPAWDPVDVELFLNSCTQSEPPVVCECQSQALQPYYSGEDALAYADQQATRGGRAILPARYKDILVRCSEGY